MGVGQLSLIRTFVLVLVSSWSLAIRESFYRELTQIVSLHDHSVRVSLNISAIGSIEFEGRVQRKGFHGSLESVRVLNNAQSVVVNGFVDFETEQFQGIVHFNESLTVAIESVVDSRTLKPKLVAYTTNAGDEQNHQICGLKTNYSPIPKGRKPRSVSGKSTSFPGNRSTCSLFIRTDVDYYNLIHETEANRNPYKTISLIVASTELFLKELNLIYRNVEFRTSRAVYSGLNFRIKKLKIMEPKECDQETHSSDKRFCTRNLDISNFLDVHIHDNYSDYCLAYTITARPFGGVLGLAYMSEAGRAGGICGAYVKGISSNSGVMTVMGLDGQRVTKAVAVTTFAHEIGHNLGAPHDPETRECSPGPPGGQYLMYAHSTIGYLDNNKKFSECSMDYLAKSMDRILVQNCLEKQGDGGICGNRLVEPGEQCDCGNEQQCQQSNDRCCYPSDFADDSSLRCTLRQGAVCSLSQGQCCDPRSCGFMEAGTVCGDLPDGCQNERSACDGSSVQCLNKPRNWLPDGTLCQSEAIATCEDGRCVGSVCAFFGLSQCTRPISKDAFRKAEFKERFRMCRVHCLVGSECVDSADFNESLCLSNSKIDCSRGFMQRSGSICADGLGFCDIFKICRAVDHEGAFDRLRGIVNDRFLKRPNQNWTVYATSVLVAMIASVILVRLCGQKPSALRRSPGNV